MDEEAIKLIIEDAQAKLRETPDAKKRTIWLTVIIKLQNKLRERKNYEKF